MFLNISSKCERDNFDITYDYILHFFGSLFDMKDIALYLASLNDC